MDGELEFSNLTQLLLVFFGSMGIFIGSILPFYFAIKPECFKLFLIESSSMIIGESLLRSSQEVEKQEKEKY